MADSDAYASSDKPDAKPDADVADIQAAFKECQEAFADNYKDALDDLRFARLGEQWPEAIRRQRELDNRPCLTINRLPAFIRQVVNDARQNKPAITVHPVDSQADPETAEIIDGLIRHIEQSSDAEVAYDTALDFACSAGFGYFGVNTRYATDDGFEQDLIIERKANPLGIYGDPESTAAESSDWNIAFELETMSEDGFKKRFKGAEAVSFEHDRYTKSDVPGERVTIAAHWCREKATKQIAALSAPDPNANPAQAAAIVSLFDPNRMVIDLAVYKANKDLFDALGMSIQGQTRDVPSFKVYQQLVSGAEVLETNDWAGKYIPIIPVYGEEIHVEGQRYFRSLIRDAKDPQRMFNFWRTASTELVALTPKTPFIGPKGAFVTDAKKWATANSATHAYIEYDTVDPETGQQISSPPQRQSFAGPPAGALQEAMNAQDDIKSILGMFDASLGAQSNETSGRAILARQREGDTGTFHIIDNLSRAIRHGGRVILDLIPQVYSTPRIVRILGADGTAQAVPIGAQGQQPAPLVTSNVTAGGAPETPQQELQETSRVFDLTLGKYDLTVTAGPSFTTRREEAANQMIELIRAYPQVAPVIGDILAKNLDWPGAEQIAERLHAMLPAVLQGDNPESDQLKAQLQSLGQALGQAKAQIVQAQIDKSLEAQRVEIEKYDAETARLKAIAPKGIPVVDPQDVQALVTQTFQRMLNDPDFFASMQQPQGPPMGDVPQGAMPGAPQPPPGPMIPPGAINPGLSG